MPAGEVAEGLVRLVRQQWIAEDARMVAPAGRWAAELRDSRQVIGGATLLPLPPDEEFEMGRQLQPRQWGTVMAPRPGWRWRGAHTSRT